LYELSDDDQVGLNEMCKRDRSMVVIQVLLYFLMADTDGVHTRFVKAVNDNLHCLDLLYSKILLIQFSWVQTGAKLLNILDYQMVSY
jgi:hypothetical protein